MEEDCKCLRFNWGQYTVIIQVGTYKYNMLDLVIDFEDEGKKSGAVLNYKYPVFSYVYKMDHVKLLNDKVEKLMLEKLKLKLRVPLLLFHRKMVLQLHNSISRMFDLLIITGNITFLSFYLNVKICPNDKFLVQI